MEHREFTLKGGHMAAKQDSDDDIDDITDEIDEGHDIDSLLESFETTGNEHINPNLTARRRIEELLEERRLREQIGDYLDLD
jgi:hypothetical protein